MNVLKQLATCQLAHLAIQVLKLAAKGRVDVAELLEIVEAWYERQGTLATLKGLCDEVDYGAAMPARREKKGSSKSASLSRRKRLSALEGSGDNKG